MVSDKRIREILRESIKSTLIKEGYIEDAFPNHTMWDKFASILGNNMMMTLIFKYIDDNDMMHDFFTYLGEECVDMGYENPMFEEDDYHPEDEDYDEDEETDDDGIPF